MLGTQILYALSNYPSFFKIKSSHYKYDIFNMNWNCETVSSYWVILGTYITAYIFLVWNSIININYNTFIITHEIIWDVPMGA